jgi:dihydroxyacid dehydratase/phosphogluconate dehydratase
VSEAKPGAMEGGAKRMKTETVPEAIKALKTRSHELTGKRRDEDHESWMKRCGTRAFVRMGGWSDADLDKPLITVAAPYTNASSCNHHFDQLAAALVQAIEENGGKAYVCHPAVITDGMTMGAEGMKFHPRVQAF